MIFWHGRPKFARGYAIKNIWLISNIMKILNFRTATSPTIYTCFPKLGQLELTNWLRLQNSRDPPPPNETWTNKVCRPGNSTNTVVNANCYQGICQCNPGYFASAKKDFCHYCPSPRIWNHIDQKCEGENDADNNCNPFSFSCTSQALTVSISHFKKKITTMIPSMSP